MKSSFIGFEESVSIMESQQIFHRKTHKRYLMDALGYVLAEDIVADHDSPEAPTAAMDGYAIRWEDQENGFLVTTGVNPAGSSDIGSLKKGEAIKTFTGSLMPEGSDTLIPIENVVSENGGIRIEKAVERGYSVREAGENYAKNETLISDGTPIDFAEAGVLAGLNRVHVEVYTRPVVSVLSTGTELLELGDAPGHPGQIRSTNNYTIEAIVKKYGGNAVSLRPVGDSKEKIAQAVQNAWIQSDIVVTTGGVSVGDYDFVKEVIAELDAELLFKGVRIKPGQHIMVARKGDRFIIGLPGFAYSSTVTALLYVVPLIARFQNRPNPLRYIRATMKDGYSRRAKNKAEFSACNVYMENGRYFADMAGKRSGTSAIMTNMLDGAGLLFVKEGSGDIEKGDIVDILLP